MTGTPKLRMIAEFLAFPSFAAQQIVLQCDNTEW
jgi:hypothetical protein